MTAQPFTGPHDDGPQSANPDDLKEYQVQNMTNWSAFVLVLCAPLSLLFAGGVAMGIGWGGPNGNSIKAITFILGLVVAVVLMIYLYRYLLQKIQVTVGQGCIRIHYLRSPFFASSADMDIVPADIASYKFDNFNGARFILYLKDGRRFRAAVGSVGKTAAIEQMAEHIIALITDKRYTQSSATLPARRATYAEGTAGLVWAGAAIGVIIAMGIAIIFFPERHKTSDTVRGIGVMFTCLAFVLHVFNLRRKARKKKELSE
jgi:hypothetical protein